MRRRAEFEPPRPKRPNKSRAPLARAFGAGLRPPSAITYATSGTRDQLLLEKPELESSLRQKSRMHLAEPPRPVPRPGPPHATAPAHARPPLPPPNAPALEAAAVAAAAWVSSATRSAARSLGPPQRVLLYHREIVTRRTEPSRFRAVPDRVPELGPCAVVCSLATYMNCQHANLQPLSWWREA